MVKVELKELKKTYEKSKVIAVDNLNLTINEGEFFTLLGPSGCGKTTTLRLIAGFEIPDEGKIFFGDEDVTYKKPYERGTAMVFQNYALWPHMTVFENVAYGLKVRKVSKEEINKRVTEVLELVKLKGMEKRYPNQLSGGQQQRVALARALVIKPRLLLLDEPLSNLDAKLRVEMREEIKRIQRELKITTIYVTHDQEEAMSISDRLAVMDAGKVLQVGTPEEVYFSPKNIFVASFFGKPNIIEAIYEGDDIASLDKGTKIKISKAEEGVTFAKGERIRILIRPEHIIPYERKEKISEFNIVKGKVVFKMFTGTMQELKVEIGENVFLYTLIPSDYKLEVGDTVGLQIPVERTLAFKAD
ncbi:ABC transporter ATP-binding protein [Fervidicoccus fontis]|uniref:ABC transporter ATP-binding protein n=1 Tax=Fervidicoccus fontis TaxID=683846 RepID=A0A843AIA1_9CREN|nr:ABC transporter ATP-binding protein [Fervidicoccus fontis]MBE9391309.1 ABC transporter ATP-binding protein [Fervidicoccus fontis]